MRAYRFISFVVVSVSSIACTTGDGAIEPAPVPAAVDPGARVPIAQARGAVVSDPQRRAAAFVNGPVGRPTAELAAATLAPIAPIDDCDIEDCDPPLPPPSATPRTISSTVLRIEFTCGEDATQLVRTSPGSRKLPTNCGIGVTSESGLVPGTTYCYAMARDDGSLATPQRCARTLFEPYVFNGPGITQEESDTMATTFDWTRTDPVAATVSIAGGQHPALYSMNILVKRRDDLFALRGLGIHTQTEPLLRDEQDAWDGSSVQARSPQGDALGAWITAIVPGPVYNDIRSQAIAGIASGHPIGIRAMVFRRIHLPGAALHPELVVSPLRPTFLGEQGLEFNGYSAVQCDPGPPQTCTVQQAVLGWLLEQAISLVVELVEVCVDAVQFLLGTIERLIFGEVAVTVQLVLRNSDEAFGLGEPTRSGWNAGTPLVLRNLRVKVHQGVGAFTGTTDANGFVTVKVARNLSGRVCFELENERVEIISTFTERDVCLDERLPATTIPITVPLVVTDKYANMLAVMTDAADYLDAVMGVDVPQVSVLTGWQSSLVTALNGGRSFTPCMGRMPNLVANIAVYSALIVPLIPALAEISEFLTAYDVVMDEDDVRSRGVAVHEYGHAATCALLREADQTKASHAWADVMVASLTGQAPTDEQSMLAEGIADFLTLQIAGGTNYFAGAQTRHSRSVNYCRGEGLDSNACVESNTLRCDGAGCDRGTNIRWVVSLLQDAFDRVPADAAEKANPSVLLPNDGSHWFEDGGILVPSRPANQISPVDSDSIQLAGTRMPQLFAAWAERGDTLRYSSFLGGLAQVLKDEGYDVAAVCAMFAAHEPGGSCPTYVTDVFGSVPPVPPPAGSVAERLAYAHADQPTATFYAPANAYSGAATPITVQRTDTGRYRVTFENLPAWGPNLSSSVAVTTTGSTTSTCSVAGFGTTATASQVDVLCWDHAGAAVADSRFSILLLGNAGLPSPSAFLTSGGPAPVPPPSPLLSWTSGQHAQTVLHGAVIGAYLVNLGVGNAPRSAKIVTARGAAGGERCINVQVISGGLQVRCYDRANNAVDGLFSVVQLATGSPGRRFGAVFAEQASAASYIPLTSTSHNSSGGAIHITRSLPGRYVVDFAGLQTPPGHTENVQVTAISAHPVTCNAVGWSSTPTGLQIAVECRLNGTTFVDARYAATIIE